MINKTSNDIVAGNGKALTKNPETNLNQSCFYLQAMNTAFKAFSYLTRAEDVKSRSLDNERKVIFGRILIESSTIFFDLILSIISIIRSSAMS